MKRAKKKDLYMLLIGVFMFLGIGYAFLTTDLSINGTSTMVGNQWSIYFDHLVVQDGSVSIENGDTAVSITSPTTISFSVKLKKPGDYYEFLVDIVNDGTLPGVITSIDVSSSNPSLSNIFGYSYTYTNGKQVKVGDIVDPSSFKTTDFKVYFKDDIDPEDLPSSDVQQTLTITITFEQSDHVEKRLCTYDGELVQGAEFVDGQYTYRYMQRQKAGYEWVNITEDGWGFMLTDKNSTDPVTTQMCGSINGKPIVATSYAFASTNASSIDLTKLYTKDVITMEGMFRFSKFDSLDASLIDTSNVVSMLGMFAQNTIADLDISHLDTSNVEDMTYMLGYVNMDSFDTSNWDTSKVTSAKQLFYSANIDHLYVNNFGGPALLNTSEMFREFTGEVEFGSIDTSHVTNMDAMFYSTNIDYLDLSYFNTSSVTSMVAMISNTKAITIDLSSFDTHNVTDFGSFLMRAPNLTTIYASSDFDLSSLQEYSSFSFQCPNLVGGSGTPCASVSNMAYARIDDPPDAPGCFTDVSEKP